jgi:UDP-2,4-diacetamido-2,4,6-trideoxy-beta-L-altropyranose hydrolase
MRVLCRSDAAVEIGTGHVFRCVTLAHALAAAGHETTFLCRELPGNLLSWVRTQGFETISLPAATGRSEREDAQDCQSALTARRFDWTIVDHYGLGAAWESAMAAIADRILAIDDLGRPHRCDLLLDQSCPNLEHQRYRDALPPDGEALLGPRFALIRPEFAQLRPASLRRARSGIARLLLFMGGSDPRNETCKALDGISRLGRADLKVDVVIGQANPHRSAVEAACARLSHANLHVQTSRMAELMAQADCAVGAGGTATWERCALGLPSLVTILAENQASVAQTVQAAGALSLVGRHEVVGAADYAAALDRLDGSALGAMSIAAAALCDGRGTERVVRRMMAQKAEPYEA